MKKGYLTAAVCWMGVIWLVSSRAAGDPFVPPLPFHLDKAAHALEYAVLGFLLGRGFGGRGKALAWALGIGALWGLLDEFHQSFVPGRDASPLDWAADTAGALAGAWRSGWQARETDGAPAAATNTFAGEAHDR